MPKADSGGAFLLSLFTSTWAAFHITVSVKQANSRLNYLLPALDWLEPLTFAVGAVVGFWAFRRCRKPGYLVIAISFCLAVFSLLALPRIKAELRARRTPAPSEETQRKINAAVSEAIERVLREEGTPPAAVERDLRFPLGPLIFVLGVWLLARREPRIERGSVLADRPER